MFKKVAVFMLLFGLPMLAWSHTCPALVDMINESLEQVELDSDTRAEVERLRDRGEAAHEDGDHEKAIEKLDEALSLLEGDMY